MLSSPCLPLSVPCLSLYPSRSLSGVLACVVLSDGAGLCLRVGNLPFFMPPQRTRSVTFLIDANLPSTFFSCRGESVAADGSREERSRRKEPRGWWREGRSKGPGREGRGGQRGRGGQPRTSSSGNLIDLFKWCSSCFSCCWGFSCLRIRVGKFFWLGW